MTFFDNFVWAYFAGLACMSTYYGDQDLCLRTSVRNDS